MKTTSIFIHRLICVLQRFLLTGIGQCGYKSDHTPRHNSGSCGASHRPLVERFSRTTLRSQEEKGQKFTGDGRNSDRSHAGQFQWEASFNSVSSNSFSTLDALPITLLAASAKSMALRESLGQGENA